MSNNSWLYKQLEQKPGLELDPQYHPLIIVRKNGIEYKIYTPNPDEYIISIDVVQKAQDMGANTISYPTTWCRASHEAIQFGKTCRIQVIPHGKLFDLLS
jgi:hypothetical protein